MRWTAYLLTLAALLLAVFAGWSLFLAVSGRSIAMDDAVAESNIAVLATSTANEPQPPRRWAAVFGEARPDEPQPPAPTQVEPPAPVVEATPPIESLGYGLKGIVRTDAGEWAVISHPTGDILVHVGEDIIQGAVLVEIDAGGAWIEQNGARKLLALPE